MPRFNTDKIVYAVGVAKHHHQLGGLVGNDDGMLSYATVQRIELNASVRFEVINRIGDKMSFDNDSIDALINALIKARNPII